MHGDTRRTKRSREYRVWANMKSRCYNPKVPSYCYYGGRGISICDEWRNDYTAFLRDMGRCPPDHSLDRINNDGNYEPGNCRWAPLSAQATNRSTTRVVEYDGERQSVAVLARKIGMPATRLVNRIDAGWSIEEAVMEETFKNQWHRRHQPAGRAP